MPTEFSIEGMTCGNCARHVTEAIQSVPEVHSAFVSLEKNQAVVRWKSTENILAVLEAVKNAGYDAKKAEDGCPAPMRRDWQPALLLGMVVTTFLMAAEWIFEPARWLEWISFALAGIVQVFSGARFYLGAWRQLKNGDSNMDTLVALGSTTAFGYSAWALLSGAGGHLYFMEAAAIITLISLGHWIEARVSEKAGSTLKLLLNLAPPRALKISSEQSRDREGASNQLPQADPADANLASREVERQCCGTHETKDNPAQPLAECPEGTQDISQGPSATTPGRATEINPLIAKPREARFSAADSQIARGHSKQTQSNGFQEVPVETLQIGDEILLRPGDRVPVDGTVLAGESAVNESSLTGEPAPVVKAAGEELFAGTVNLDGRLIMRVTATGDETVLAHVIAAVQHAQTSRANIQRLGDRVSGIFVPVIVLIALAAGLWWGLAPQSANGVHAALAHILWQGHVPAGAAAGFIIAAAVLIIACPCAMGLATPAAIMAGANAAARRGILIRDGVALEKAGAISAIIFDKTGTLTLGKPEVAGIYEAQNSTANARNLAAALARDSAHPLSQAIANLSAERINLTHWREIRGAGLEAEIEQSRDREGASNQLWNTMGHRSRPDPQGIVQESSHTVESATPNIQPLIANPREARNLSAVPRDQREAMERIQEKKIRLGSLRWFREIAVDFSPGEKFISEWSDQGASIIGLAAGTRLLALFALRDVVKPHAADVITQLQRSGLAVYLVTGDNSRTASSIALKIGIKPENVFAEMRPEQKAGFVKKLQSDGGRVAFVGDGINDAPALAQADLGIAVSRASDIAREAADIILLKSEITGVPEALGLARATLKTIKQNLFWAFFYNALGVPLAALGFVSPILCAAAMGVSDLIVIGNALRLLRWRK